MTDRASDARQAIEVTIDRARQSVGETIDEIDGRIRSQLDLRKFAGEHTPQIVIASTAIGFVLGYSAPRAFARIAHVGLPLALAYAIVRKARARADQATDRAESSAVGAPVNSPESWEPSGDDLLRQ